MSSAKKKPTMSATGANKAGSHNIKRSRRNAHVACLPPEPFDGAFLLLLVQRTPGEERFCI